MHMLDYRPGLASLVEAAHGVWPACIVYTGGRVQPACRSTLAAAQCGCRSKAQTSKKSQGWRGLPLALRELKLQARPCRGRAHKQPAY